MSGFLSMLSHLKSSETLKETVLWEIAKAMILCGVCEVISNYLKSSKIPWSIDSNIYFNDI